VEGADASSIKQEHMLKRTDLAESITIAFISLAHADYGGN